MSVETADIVVIGAGMSGLSAASRLTKPGTNKVVVLEARDRVGGRVWTAHMKGDTKLDIGGAWLQYPGENPVEPHLEGVKRLPTPPESIAVYVADEESGKAPEATPEQLSAIMAKIAEWREKAPKETPSEDVKALDVLPMLENDKILGSKEELEKNAALLMREITENYVASNIEDLSGVGLVEGATPPEQVILQEGFEVAANRLAEGLDIRLEHVIKKIEVVKPGALVQVTTDSGKVFEAPKVLVTVPLGVLKQKKIEFVPPLPKSKLDCIDRLGFGLLDKVCLKFPSVFWKKDAHFIVCLSEDRTLPKMFLNKAACNGKPILVAFHQGGIALENEKLDDKALAEKVMTLLRKMHGNDIPEPEEIVCTRWGSDPFSCGAYTAVSYIDAAEARERGLDYVGPFRYEDLKGLAEPIDKTLYFAGEASSDTPGLIHGAYNSGVRAAKEIQEDLA